jgi:thiol-disulfide isomerase/thioredoxin
MPLAAAGASDLSRPSLAIALPALIAVLLAACDTQTAPAGQGTATDAPPPAAPEPTQPSATRYRVDRSNAGQAIPTDRLVNPAGGQAALSTLTGKPLLVNLWATWCAPCIEELPTLDRVAREAGDAARVVLVSQDIGDDANVPRAFLSERNLRLTTWHDPENAVGLAYGQSLPTTILFGADGKEVVRVIGPLDWTNDEAKALLREAGFPR